jgi:hypothetical protein
MICDLNLVRQELLPRIPLLSQNKGQGGRKMISNTMQVKLRCWDGCITNNIRQVQDYALS